MAYSKWDKISKSDAKELVERIKYVDRRRGGGFNAYDLGQISMYSGNLAEFFKLSFHLYRDEELVELGEEWVYFKHHEDYPTIAEVLYQLPKQYAHKVQFYELSLFNIQDVADENCKRVKVRYYKQFEPEVTQEGPLTARQMYINLIKQAMEPRSEHTGMLQYTSLPDATQDRNQMAWLRKLLEAAENMPEEVISDAVATFWLKAFRQR
jgi:hypothetical protein